MARAYWPNQCPQSETISSRKVKKWLKTDWNEKDGIQFAITIYNYDCTFFYCGYQKNCFLSID